MGSTDSLNCHVLWFVDILKHGREEQVSVQLAFQNKRVERPVRNMFLDYLSISCDLLCYEGLVCRPLDTKLEVVSSCPCRIGQINPDQNLISTRSQFYLEMKNNLNFLKVDSSSTVYHSVLHQQHQGYLNGQLSIFSSMKKTIFILMHQASK